ncbi:hypothetical protein [Mycobacterium sp. KBS0706]|uniref:hypothetical protein n=1 Tax=Mycobacterium sp. KBS0706 TaxID=2578109 RepID=UPI00163D7930|nr:hypothetical protein [Mycobacterium sp. KBS0706]
MTLRTRSETVTFTRPFVLSGIDGAQPPGTYTVETDEEPLDVSSPPVYRRIATMIRLAGRPGTGELVRVVTVDPEELAAALARDAEPSPHPTPAESSAEGRTKEDMSSNAREGEQKSRHAVSRPFDRALEGWRDWPVLNLYALAWTFAIACGALFVAYVASR